MTFSNSLIIICNNVCCSVHNVLGCLFFSISNNNYIAIWLIILNCPSLFLNKLRYNFNVVFSSLLIFNALQRVYGYFMPGVREPLSLYFYINMLFCTFFIRVFGTRLREYQLFFSKSNIWHIVVWFQVFHSIKVMCYFQSIGYIYHIGTEYLRALLVLNGLPLQQLLGLLLLDNDDQAWTVSFNVTWS